MTNFEDLGGKEADTPTFRVKPSWLNDNFNALANPIVMQSEEILQNTLDILELQAENSLDSGQSANIVRDFFYVEEKDFYDNPDILQDSSYLGTIDEDNTDAPYDWWYNKYDNSNSVVSEDKKTVGGDDYSVIETIEQTGYSPYMTALYDQEEDDWIAKVTYHYTDGTTEDSNSISGRGRSTAKIENPNPDKEIEKQELKGKNENTYGNCQTWNRFYKYEEAEDKEIQTNRIDLMDDDKDFKDEDEVTTNSETYEVVKEFDNIDMYIDKVDNELQAEDEDTDIYCKIRFYYDDGTDEDSDEQKRTYDSWRGFEYENPEPYKLVNKIEVMLRTTDDTYEAREKNTEFYGYTLQGEEYTYFQLFAWKPEISNTGNITAEVSFDGGSNYTTANLDEATEIPEGERGERIIIVIKLNAEDSDGLASCKGYGIMFWE